jgi:hypothetical protein
MEMGAEKKAKKGARSKFCRCIGEKMIIFMGEGRGMGFLGQNKEPASTIQ